MTDEIMTKCNSPTNPDRHHDHQVYSNVEAMNAISFNTNAVAGIQLVSGLQQNADSSGSSEESSSRDMSVSQSQNVDHGEGIDVMTISASEADISIQSGSNQSPKPELELGSPLPDDMVSSPTDTSTPNFDHVDNEAYKCRFCPFLARNYTQLQVHMPKHAGMKALTCTLCDYATNDKSNFKRHKRLHVRVNPVNVIKCDKCTYTTILPRKIREHYRQEHNTIYTCRHPEFPESPVSFYAGPRPPETGHMSLQNADLTLGQPTMNRTMPVAPSALHSLLTSVRPSRLEYTRPQNHAIPPNLGQYVEGYDSHSQPLARVQEPHMASNYLRSIVSTVMPTPLHRVAATSTITSSSYYLTQAGAGHRHMIPTHPNAHMGGMSTMNIQLGHAVKVKQEPVDMVMDAVSSSGGSCRTPEPIRHYEDPIPHLQRRGSLDPPDSGSYMSLDRGNEAVPATFTNRVGSSDSDPRQELRREGRYFSGEILGMTQPNTAVKTEMSSIGVQCAMPVVKQEPVDKHASSETHKRRQRNTMMLIERGTQCELIQSSRCSTQSRSESCGSGSESSEQQGSISGDSCARCPHCGVMFDDEVLYSIHIGCHSHTDPFVCNVCGKQCHNKYGFYSHIMRGHQC